MQPLLEVKGLKRHIPILNWMESLFQFMKIVLQALLGPTVLEKLPLYAQF